MKGGNEVMWQSGLYQQWLGDDAWALSLHKHFRKLTHPECGGCFIILMMFCSRNMGIFFLNKPVEAVSETWPWSGSSCECSLLASWIGFDKFVSSIFPGHFWQEWNLKMFLFCLSWHLEYMSIYKKRNVNVKEAKLQFKFEIYLTLKICKLNKCHCLRSKSLSSDYTL